MKFLAVSLSAISLLALHTVSAANVTDISDCPALAPRSSPPTSASDLRIDDISVVAALGDSIMAGFALEGVDYDGTGLLNISAIMEYRGKSYAIGGDSGAVTLANFVKHYNSNVQGASLGYHPAELCYGTLCVDFIRYPNKDVLNAAFSGALAMNLDTELDYLIKEMKSIDGIDYQNDWKMITIQIGSNDQCASCLSPFQSEVTADKWGSHVEAVVDRIKSEVPRVVVNLLGVFEVSQVYTLTEGQSYCHPLLNVSQAIINRVECSCFLGSDQNRSDMDTLVASYNQKLEAIYEKYKGEQNSTFAVAYQPANINILGFPIDILSNVDCFHPNYKAHAWIAKAFWNQLFLPQSQKGGVLEYDANEEIYCPTEDDRIQI